MNMKKRMKKIMLVLFLLINIYIPSTSPACDVVEYYFACSVPSIIPIPPDAYMEKGSTRTTLTLIDIPVLTYTAPEDGYYVFITSSWDSHQISYACYNPDNCIDYWQSTIQYCDPPLEIASNDSFHVWKYMGEISGSADYSYPAGCIDYSLSASEFVYLYSEKGLEPEELNQNLGEGDEISNPAIECGFSKANFSTGNLYKKYTLSFGFMDLILSYNSLDRYKGHLGKGWSHTFNANLTPIKDDSLILMKGDGRRVKYTSIDEITFTPEKRFGLSNTLTKHTDTFTLREKDGTLFNFDSNGRLVSIMDRNSNKTTLIYTDNQLTTIEDPYKRQITISHSNGKIASMTDPLGRDYTFSYTGDFLTSITDPEGRTTRYDYDSNGKLQSSQDPEGGTTTYTYDADGRILSSTDPPGNTKSIEYTEDGKARITDRNGNTTEYLYDRAFNAIVQKTDSFGYKTHYTYDERGNILSITYPDGTTGNSTYDTDDNLLTSTDPGGYTTSYSYESTHHQITSMKDVLGRETKFTYDTKGNLLTITDPIKHTTTFTYDNKGRITGITAPDGNTVSIAYDLYGNIATIKDALGNTTTSVSDILGNLIESTDAKGNTTTYTHDKHNRLISVTDALNQITTYTYNQGCSSCGNSRDKVTAITDANGNTTRFDYDPKGRLIERTDPLGNIITYTYDGEGNRTSKTDANGNTITYAYDPLNRLIKKTYPDETAESFTYDLKGKLIGATNKHIHYTFSYDPNGRLISVGDSNERELSYQYDAIGKKTQVITPEGKPITYTYDATNRLTGIDFWEGTFAFLYDSAGRRTELTYPNGVLTTYSHDKAGRLLELLTQNAQLKRLNSFAYTYDDVGNRLSKTETTDRLPFKKGAMEKETLYTYDPINQLTEVVTLKSEKKGRKRVLKGKTEEYDYDALGNRLRGPGDQDDYTCNEDNQLMSDRNHHYDYDKNGDLIGKTKINDDGHLKTFTYTYDYENRLTKVEVQVDDKGRKTITFKYDPFGRRIEKTITKHRNGTTRAKSYAYVYDNEDIILEYMTRTKGNKTRTAITRYLHGPGIDEPLAMEKEDRVYYYHADGLGTITALSNQNGKVVQRYKYDSFGKRRHRDHKVNQPYTFTGREWDKETGLYYYRARYYDPEIGRFISKDPIGFAGGDTNLYRYVGNSPLNWIDPLGLIWATIGYDYQRNHNFLDWLRNRITGNIGRGLNPTLPLSDPEEFVGMTRDVIQKWQQDPNNPCRDNEHAIGTIRRIRQTYMSFPNRGPGKDLINDPKKDFYYQWHPWVSSPAYDYSAPQY